MCAMLLYLVNILLQAKLEVKACVLFLVSNIALALRLPRQQVKW